MNLSVPLILASGSPRRQHLLTTLGIPFQIQKAEIEELVTDNEAPSDMVIRLAIEKASVVAASRPACLVLGADTTVLLDGDMLGKPADSQSARHMLRQLSGRSHTVLTGIALIHRETERISSAVEATKVAFDTLSDEEIQDYVRSGSPLDKAGSYGIQDDRGALFVTGIQGDFYNVMGLPLHRLYRLLKDNFSDLFAPAL